MTRLAASTDKAPQPRLTAATANKNTAITITFAYLGALELKGNVIPKAVIISKLSVFQSYLKTKDQTPVRELG